MNKIKQLSPHLKFFFFNRNLLRELPKMDIDPKYLKHLEQLKIKINKNNHTYRISSLNLK